MDEPLGSAAALVEGVWSTHPQPQAAVVGLVGGESAEGRRRLDGKIGQQPGLDPERVMLLGFSMGGLVSALAAEKVRPHRLALWSPALPELWLRHLRGGLLPPVVSDYGGWPLGRAFLQEVVQVRPLEVAARWGGVAHVFHGDADQTCPPAWGVRYAEALRCDATAIPGANHTYDSLEQVEMLHRETVLFLTGG